MADDNRCIGKWGVGGCKYRVVAVIAGDLACVYHVGTTVTRRLREIGGPIAVERYDKNIHDENSSSHWVAIDVHKLEEHLGANEAQALLEELR